MTKDCNVFQDKTTMGPDTVKANDDPNAPVRTAQSSDQPMPGQFKNDFMSVKNLNRPRRGHDY